MTLATLWTPTLAFPLAREGNVKDGEREHFR
jgi:hypothetical protein